VAEIDVDDAEDAEVFDYIQDRGSDTCDGCCDCEGAAFAD
jgi:hypothetical protein